MYKFLFPLLLIASPVFAGSKSGTISKFDSAFILVNTGVPSNVAPTQYVTVVLSPTLPIVDRVSGDQTTNLRVGQKIQVFFEGQVKTRIEDPVLVFVN
jgi:hypothetical protein